MAQLQAFTSFVVVQVFLYSYGAVLEKHLTTVVNIPHYFVSLLVFAIINLETECSYALSECTDNTKRITESKKEN